MEENRTGLTGEQDPGRQGEKTFTQEDVNRIVQERLSREKGKQDEDLSKRAAELDRRERRMNAVQKLRDNGLPDYLADALNMETDDAFEESMKAVMKMKKESGGGPRVVGTRDVIGRIDNMYRTDGTREAFGLK